MNRKIILGAVITTLLASSGVAMSDDDDDDHDGRKRGLFSRFFSKAGVTPVNNQPYIDECGSCHFAFQPGLLPARSWKKLMGGLDDHFGENAEFDSADAQKILNYLVAGAADTSSAHRSQSINNSIPRNSAPLRISETRYFLRKHDEIPPRYVTGNPKVGSFSNCEKCHTEAAKGSFSEHGVHIPGVGRWD
ncbi:MAG: diheme cytochrome c [Chromatiales bacterium]|nr:diheme cytochrome c [Chromatiales bacterium]